MSQLDIKRLQTFVDGVWEESILPALNDYIRIPNVSPAFDPDWAVHGHMDDALRLACDWCRAQLPADATLDVVRLPGRTPVLLIDIPGQGQDTVLLYGHLDKQPEMEGWREGLGPFQPVREADKLYGRGGADDGYAVFGSLTAINALRAQGVPHARCVVLIETCEESGSYDLPAYVDELSGRIGKPNLVVCLDSGCGNYEQLWCTTSLRGVATFTLRVGILREGVHSGDASGVVASSFRILRQLLDRLEDAQTGMSRLALMHAEIPAERRQQARAVASELGEAVYTRFPWLAGVRPVGGDLDELILNRTWRPSLSVIGAEGLPPLGRAGNVLRPETALRISLRLPPTVAHGPALEEVTRVLTADPPLGAQVKVQDMDGASGWNAPALSPWLSQALSRASEACFGKPALYMGEGGSIPFMGMLGEKFPHAQFVITGLLGPGSNPHGPNEFLHIPMAKHLTACISHILADHAAL